MIVAFATTNFADMLIMHTLIPYAVVNPIELHAEHDAE